MFAWMAGPAQAASPTGEFVSVPASIQTMVGTLLPEASQMGSIYLSNTFDPNLVVTQPATLRVVFVSEGAGYRNTLGYFVYHTDGTAISIVDRGLILPNASFADPNRGWGGGSLVTGDAVTITDASGAPRVFQPGDYVGLFVVANGWNGSSVTGWNAASPTIPSTSGAVNAKVAQGLFTTVDAINPESAAGRPDVGRHVAMLRVSGTPGFLGGKDFLLTAFEDLNRTGSADNDFNDLVVILDASPIAAIASSAIPSYISTSTDPDGDGVAGLIDYFPTDPLRATLVRQPATGFQTVAFEDSYPSLGDSDFNDAVVQCVIEQVLDRDGRVRDIVGTYHLIARGAGYDAAFGVGLYSTTPLPAGTIEFERFTWDGISSLSGPVPLGERLQASGSGSLLRIDDVFPSTRAALPPLNGAFTNTTSTTPDRTPASVRFRVTFAAPVDPLTLDAAPFDVYLRVPHPDGSYDIHLPGRSGLPDRPTTLPVESGATSFVDDHGTPWAMLVPSDWRYGLEKVPVATSYAQFSAWRDSAGTQSRTWYNAPTVDKVIAPLGASVRTRAWALSAVP